jgi:hypothetical protein
VPAFPVVHLHPEGGVRQHLCHHAAEFDLVALAHRSRIAEELDEQPCGNQAKSEEQDDDWGFRFALHALLFQLLAQVAE